MASQLKAKTAQFIRKNKAPFVVAQKIGTGLIFGVQQAGLEELDARNPNRNPTDFLAVQNLVPIIETGVLIPVAIMAKNNTVRVLAGDAINSTATMMSYRIAKMATPIIANRMRKAKSSSFMDAGHVSRKSNRQERSIMPSTGNLGLFSAT